MFEFLKKRTGLLYDIVLILFLILIGLFIWGIEITINGQNDVVKSVHHLRDVDALIRSISEAKTYQRGFITTGTKDILNSYYLEVENIRSLSSSIKNNLRFPQQPAIFERIAELIDNELEQLDQEIIVRIEQGYDQAKALAQSRLDSDLINQIEQEFEVLNEYDKVDIDTKTPVSLKGLALSMLVFIILISVLSVLVVSYAGKRIRKSTKEIEELTRNLANKNMLLEERNKQYEILNQKLEVQNQELKNKSDDLEKLNKGLIEREMKMISLKEELDKLKS